MMFCLTGVMVIGHFISAASGLGAERVDPNQIGRLMDDGLYERAQVLAWIPTQPSATNTNGG